MKSVFFSICVLLVISALQVLLVESCKIPKIINGNVLTSEDGSELGEGTEYTDFFHVNVKCNPSFSLIFLKETDNYIFCIEGEWSKKFLKCEKLCKSSKLTSLSSYATKCELDDIEVPCDQNNPEGTMAYINCKLGYEVPSGFTRTLICLDNGEWNHALPNCLPVCGLQTPQAKNFIVGGGATLPTAAPWNVAVYRNKELICGGTILGVKLVLSAAHCFYVETAGVITLNPINIFQIVAGKYHRDFYTTEDQIIQTFGVTRISSPGYKGAAGLNEADIASIVLDGYIVYQPHIVPICLDLNVLYYSQLEFAKGSRGFVAGWGNTGPDQIPSEILRSIEIPVVSHADCKRDASQDFQPFVLPDKLCAGYKDGFGVCSGDSGAGLAFPRQDGSRKVYYLRGIVSNGKQSTNGCDLSFYVLFTNVLDYLPFIKKEIKSVPTEYIDKVTPTQSKKIVCFYGTWATYRVGNGKFEVEDINPNLCTHIVYTYFSATVDGTMEVRDKFIDLEENYGRGNIKKFIGLKNKNRKLKLLAAVGGWNMPANIFTTIAASPEIRTKFAKNVREFLRGYGFDGLSIDWNYPAQRDGAPADKANFVLLLAELRKYLEPAVLLLVASVGATENLATLSYDIPGISAQVDFLNLMTYDMHASWENFTGIHAPNKVGPGDVTPLQKQLSMEACVRFWLANGAPAEKIVVAIPTNGKSYTLADASIHGIMAPTTGDGKKGQFTNEPGRLGYNEICISNWTRVFDPIQQAPYAYSGDQWFGYDDKQSVAIKCSFINQNNLGGATIWSLETDDFRGDCGLGTYPLLKLVHRSLR